MRVVIDHERYGERSEFDTIEEAQAVIRDCGEEFAGVTLRLGHCQTDDRGEPCEGRVIDERGEIVGYVYKD